MKSNKTPIRPQAIKKPTEQELERQRTIALRQKMMSIAEASLIALAGNPAFASYDPKDISDRAFAIAETWMAEYYGLVKKAPEETK